MTKVLVVGGGLDSVDVARLLRSAGIETEELSPSAREALLPLGGGRWPDPDPRIFQPFPAPKGEPLIVLRDPAPEDLRRIEAAKRKRERRQERNLRNGPHPEGLWLRDGDWYADCRSCGRTYALSHDAREFSPDMSYCGGSSYCMP